MRLLLPSCSHTKFPIPEIATKLSEVPDCRLDLRQNADIVTELNSFRPVISEKNVWAFWDKGFDAMPPSYQCTVINWVRKLGSGWTVRLTTTVDKSPNSIYNFIDKNWLPECLIDGTMDGTHKSQHTSDLVRLPLLFEHGGVWMDVGNMLHTHLDDLFWNRLTATESSYEVGLWIMNGKLRKKWGSFGNFIVAARKNAIFIRNWHEGYKELWKGRNNERGFHEHPLIQEIGIADCVADWTSNQEFILGMTDYVAHMLIGDRTRNLLDIETGWNGREFFENRALLVEGVKNSILGALKTRHDGATQVDLFTTRLDEPNQEKRKAAEAFMVEMLEDCHMYKVYHNPIPAGGKPTLGDLIKTDGLKDADQRPGTFGELYRYGTVHWRSAKQVEYLIPPPSEDKLIQATPTKPSERSS
ncbi:hypothetical protein LY78DRAFT_588400 [Colletotrichum sublineola]|uniref:Capsule polysaccharide biosynthesis protein n=1 Tax=Colletotrichum sublineola TaxID=1173701 RepID=A0A066WXA9_COLSU|nr:hypothetical protein LY78DRAFT_588400 [Colletotrichum sublineola]KDN60054.1 hypothetical protein CSUB01_11515 [Colletotrichum sublineola]